jgi:23S rRNA pseudouridine955/2504/2580 synthase
MIINSSQVPDSFNNYRVDSYLAERFTYLSRSRWQKEITEGRLLLNGKKLTSHHKRVRAGDTISYSGRDEPEPDVLRDYREVYRDRWILAVDKPGNIPVHPSGVFLRNTLLTLLEEDYNTALYPVHRLDRETSGIILFAQDRDTASAIQKNFHLVKKSYLAIVRGIPVKREFRNRTSIGNNSVSQVRKKRKAFHGAGENAETRFSLLYSKGGFSLIKAVPVTGRTHQIRVHCEHSGFPILGDKLYGPDERNYLEFIENGNSEELIKKTGFHRSALHSYSIRFYHPGKDEDMLIRTPFPSDFRDFFRSLK